MLVVRAVVRSDDDEPSGERATTTVTEADDERSTTTEAGPTTTLAEGDLAGRALRAADLPDGWFAAEGAPLELCPDGDPFGDVRPSSAAQTAFAAGVRGPFVTSRVAEYPDEERARDLLEAAEEAVDECGSYTLDGTRYEVEEIAAPEVGDEVVAARVTGTTDTGDVAGPIYFARVGRRVAAVALLAVDARPDEALAREALETVVARL